MSMFRNHLIPYSQRNGPASSSTDTLENPANDHLVHSLCSTACPGECREDEYGRNRRVFTAKDVAEFSPYDDHTWSVSSVNF